MTDLRLCTLAVVAATLEEEYVKRRAPNDGLPHNFCEHTQNLSDDYLHEYCRIHGDLNVYLCMLPNL